MTASVRIRPMVDEDLERVLQLNNDAVPAVNAHQAASLSALVTLAENAVVIEVDSVVAGFLLLLDGPGRPYDSMNYAWFSQRYERFFYVDRIVIGAAFRGQRLGRKLYEWAIETGSGTWPVLCAEVNIKPRNQVSLDFHDALDFKVVGEQDTEGGTKRVAMLCRELS